MTHRRVNLEDKPLAEQPKLYVAPETEMIDALRMAWRAGMRQGKAGVKFMSEQHAWEVSSVRLTLMDAGYDV